MRRWSFLLAAACALVWSNLAAAAPTTDGSGSDGGGTRVQRKEAMVRNKNLKADANKKGGGVRTGGKVHVTHTTIPGNFKISENEGPLPPNRVFFTSNYYRGGVGPEVFVGVSVTAAIEQTNFAVSEPFNVNGSGVMGGIFGGVLLPVPNTNILMGPRVGWEGGNINGSKEAIPFTYFVTTNSMFFQEALVKVPFRSPFEFYSDNANHLSLNDISPYLDPYITASAGIAEVHEVVKGTSGAFSVTSSVFSPGITFTVGGGVPIARELFGFEKTFLGGNADIVVQWRGTLATGTVKIPGAVPQAYFINAIEGGLVIHN